ncbi:RNA polymerase sigma-70 factor [Flavobacterium rhamnosiphilum]|uniref:RNA polymerase sigma-70 factor n=1 Tax=Flavobacterium rhamnosiphilum TaxID=2541724 RepID=A0A4R5FBH4_9FLAO|nr:RNA polymerase sigma-70 factor [Flavobacterium rhamnosiphilum]TDE46579.1 RNA polymerase sigma-70 factor [Flavobacterium rhamnosiphilum]
MIHSFKHDNYLIEALKNGNEEAYKYLYANKYKDIVHYINGLTRDYDKAEDIVQEVIFRLWKNRSEIEITSSIKSYLYKAAYYSFINEYKKDKRKESLSEKNQKTAVLELIESDEEYTQQKLRYIAQIIEQLPPKRKEIFIMCKTEGLTYEEIASHLEISVKTVETQMGKALYQIRSKIRETNINKAVQIIFLLHWPFLK